MTSALIGRKVEFTAVKGVFRPCDYCGSTLFEIFAGTAVHALHARCDKCGRGGRWIGKNLAARLAQQEGIHA